MIEYIKGKIDNITPTTIVLETPAGVGYLLNISLPAYEKLKDSSEAKLLVHEVIREDTWSLYGFLTERERELFRALIGVSGVGAATATVIMSSMAVRDLELVIANGDDSRLKKVKGIGQKTAQRIIVDLRGKIKLGGSDEFVPAAGKNNDAYEEALAALIMLGFTKPASQKVLDKIFDLDPATKVETAIKKALTML